ncbi:MAG: ABC transporter permease [Ferruginibacter sp.]
MQKLLRTEWLKLKNYNAFIVLSSFFALGVLTTNYIVFTVNKNIVGKINTAGLVNSFNPYDFDKTWQTTSYATGWLLMLPALLLIILVTNEFTYRTSRQNIIDGWSRQQFIAVKLALAVITAVVTTLLVISTALIFGLFSGSSFSLNGVSHVLFFFLKALSYNLIAVLISVWIRRTGFAIGLYFIYLGAENIISQLLDVWSIKLRSEQGIDLGSMGDYLPMNASDGLLTFPDNPIKSFAKGNLPTDYTWLVIILALSYVVLFYYLSRRSIVKRDL